jgi:hypothetical protein
MRRKEQIIDELKRLPAADRMEQGLVEAIDEANRDELVDGSDAFAQQRRRLRGA